MTEEKEINQEAQPEKTTKKKPNKTIAIILTVVVTVVVIYGVASNSYRALTQRTTEKAVEQAIEKTSKEKAEVDISEGGKQISIETEEATFTAGKQELPKNFPSDLPTYPGSSILSTSSNADSTVVILSTDDSVQKVADFYKKKLVEGSWEVETTASMANASILGINKGKLSGGIVISEADEGTQIIIELEKESND